MTDEATVLGLGDRLMLLCAAGLIVGGYLHIQVRVVRRLAPERIAALAVVSAWTTLDATVPGAIVLGVVVVILAAMQAITWRRFRMSVAASRR